jgi:tetratricopeptide (TPR) repeat protein
MGERGMMMETTAGRLAAASIMVAFLLPAACRSARTERVATSRPAEPARPEVSATSAPQASDERAVQPASGPAPGDLNKVGKVVFPTSCDAKVQAEFERGVALLHSFFYEEAHSIFESVTRQDPNCAIGFWGIAMTFYHPIWAPPTPEEMESGTKAAEQARGKATPATSERERLLIDSIAAFYRTDDAGAPAEAMGQSCHGPTGGHPARAKAYWKAMKHAHERLPDDEEVTAFYALSLLGSAAPADLELKNQKQAAALLEKLWARRQDHPGVAHYLIHSYDYPPLARRGLPAAMKYASIAPRVPHVLHMPSHIFVRLGMWREAIDSNLASAEAARAYVAQKHPGATSMEELHANDYAVYAYLQTGQDEKARQLVVRSAAMKTMFPPMDMAGAYAAGAIPARFAIERHAWQEAARLTVPQMEFWARFPFTEAHIEYARGLGRARSGDVQGARQSLARLAQLRDATKDARFAYFKNHLELQHQAVTAWVARAERKDQAAVKALRKAAEMEEKLGKHPVSPGPVYPIREQLGELLLELDRPAEALVAFRASLKISPHRFYGLHGAAQAARLAGKEAEARKYFEELIALAGEGDGKRREIDEARQFLDAKGK